MSENFGQKKGSNQAKTKKESENTNEIVNFIAEGSDPTSFQWEIATKKSKKKKVKNQKNESSTVAIDESRINDQGVDGSQDLKIGDCICVENHNEKPAENKNLQFDIKKKEALNSNSLDNIIVSTKENEYNNDFPVLVANDATNEGINKKILKKKRRLDKAKEKNELEITCPEEILKNLENEMTVDSRGSKEKENDNTTKESEEKPKRRRRRRNTKSKSALESCSSGKLIKDSVESIIEDNHDHDNKQKTEEEKLPTVSNEESRSNTIKTVETVYRAPIKRKSSANLEEETKNILENFPNSVDALDSKQTMVMDTNSGTESTTSKRRKRNKNKSKNDVSGKVGEEVGNKDCHIGKKKESEHSLPEKNKSKLSEEIEDLKIFQDNCKILDKKIKSKQLKTNTSVSALPIKTDQNCTSHNQSFPHSYTSSTFTPPVEIVPLAEKLDSVESFKQVDKKCKKSKSKNKQLASIDSKDEEPQLVTKVDENLETKKEVALISKHIESESDEKSMNCKSDHKLHGELVEDQHEQKISKSKNKHHDSAVVETLNKQSDVKSNNKSKQNRSKGNPLIENEAQQMLKSVSNMEQGDDTVIVEKIERGQRNSKIEMTPATVSDDKINYSQSVLDENLVNNNNELTKLGIGRSSKRDSSHDLDSKITQNVESHLEKTDITNTQQDDNKNKKSKLKKKKNNTQQVATTDTSKIDKGKKVGEESQPVLGANAETEEIFEISSGETTSKVEVINAKNLVSENDSKSKRCVSFCSEPILFKSVDLVDRENEDENGMSKEKLKKRRKVRNKIDKEINKSTGDLVQETNHFSSLSSTASMNILIHNNLEFHHRDSDQELHNSGAANFDNTNTILQHFNFSDMQKYDLFAISEAEKRFAKLLESEYNSCRNNFSTHNTTALNIDPQNDSYRDTKDPDIDSLNDCYAKATKSNINLSNNYAKCIESDDSIVHNYTNSTDGPLIINHFEDGGKEIPEEMRASNPGLQRFSDNFSITPISNCNEKSYDRKCTLSWSQIAAKETHTKYDVSQEQASSENQQKKKQKSLESSKPVCIKVADRPSRADTDIAAADSEGFVKYVSKREMRKHRSRTSSRNDEQVVSQAVEEIQNEKSIPLVKKSDSKVKVMSESADESSQLEGNSVRFLFETGLWMDKWKYHDAEVEFFESKEKIRHSLATELLQNPTSDNDDDKGCSSASEPPSPAKGKRRKSRRGRKRNKDKGMSSEADDSNYTSDEDPMNLNRHVVTTPSYSQSVNEQGSTQIVKNDTSNDDTDSHISNTNRNSSRKIKQLFVMILMELYFMLIYYASGLKKRKKVE